MIGTKNSALDVPLDPMVYLVLTSPQHNPSPRNPLQPTPSFPLPLPIYQRPLVLQVAQIVLSTPGTQEIWEGLKVCLHAQRHQAYCQSRRRSNLDLFLNLKTWKKVRWCLLYRRLVILHGIILNNAAARGLHQGIEIESIGSVKGRGKGNGYEKEIEEENVIGI